MVCRVSFHDRRPLIVSLPTRVGEVGEDGHTTDTTPNGSTCVVTPILRSLSHTESPSLDSRRLLLSLFPCMPRGACRTPLPLIDVDVWIPCVIGSWYGRSDQTKTGRNVWIDFAPALIVSAPWTSLLSPLPRARRKDVCASLATI